MIPRLIRVSNFQRIALVEELGNRHGHSVAQVPVLHGSYQFRKSGLVSYLPFSFWPCFLAPIFSVFFTGLAVQPHGSRSDGILNLLHSAC
jgi:hypothetical protein